MELRKFTNKGLNEFENYYLAVCSNGNEPEEFDNSTFLTDEYSTVISKSSEMPKGPFRTRYDLGKTLSNSLGKLTFNNTDTLMWSWLACYYFDIIFTKPSGGLKLGELANVILNDSPRRKFRHKIFGPVYFFNEFGVAAKPLLNKHPNVAGEVYENISGRPSLLSVSFLGIMKKIMWDEKNGDWKKGAGGRRAQGANSLGKLLKQLAVNNFVINCETPESQDALIEKFPANQKP